GNRLILPGSQGEVSRTVLPVLLRAPGVATGAGARQPAAGSLVAPADPACGRRSGLGGGRPVSRRVRPAARRCRFSPQPARWRARAPRGIRQAAQGLSTEAGNPRSEGGTAGAGTGTGGAHPRAGCRPVVSLSPGRRRPRRPRQVRGRGTPAGSWLR